MGFTLRNARAGRDLPSARLSRIEGFRPLGRIGFLSLFLLLCAGAWAQATWEGDVVGSEQDWGNPGNWNPFGVPGAGTNVIIPNTVNDPILDLNRSCASLTIQAGGNVDLGGRTLTVTGAVSNAGTLLLPAGSSLSATDFTSGGAVNTSGASTLSFSGNVDITGTWTTPANAALTLSGAGRTLAAVPTIPPLTVTGSYTLTAALAVNGSVTVSNILDLSTYGLTGPGSFTNNGTLRISGGNQTIAGARTNGGASTVTYYGTGAAGMNWGASYNNLVIAAGASGVFAASAPLSVAGTLAVNAAALSLAGNALDANGDVSGAGELRATGAEAIAVAGNWTVTSFTEAGSTVTFDGGAAQNAGGDASFNNLIVDKAAGTMTFANALTANALTVTASGGTTFSSTVGAASATLANTTGTIDFQGLATIGALSVAANGFSLRFGNGASVTGAANFQNTGNLTVANGLTATGNITSTGAGVNSLAGAIVATGFAVSLDDVTIGAGGVSFNAGAAGDLTVSGAVTGGGNNLTIVNALSPDFQGNVGGVGILTVTQTAAGLRFQGSVGAATVTLTDTTGTIQFDGALTAATLNTANETYGLSLLGGATIANPVTLQNSGLITLGNASTDALAFNGGLTANSAATRRLFAAITTTADAVTLGDLVLDGDSSINTSATGGGTISLAAVSGAFELSLNAGTAGVAQTAGLIASGDLRIRCAGNIGAAGDPIDTDVARMELLSTGGLVNAQNASALVLGYAGGAGDFAGSGSSASFTLAAGGILTIAEAVSAGVGNAVILTATDMAVNAAVTGPAGITLQPSADASTIALQDGIGAFSLTEAELQLLSANASTVTLGRTTGTGQINIGQSGGINLSAEDYSLLIEGASSAIDFRSAGTAVTMGGLRTLGLSGGGAVTSNGGGTDVASAGTGPFIIVQATSVGSVVNPIVTDIIAIRGATSAGGIYVSEASAIALGSGGGSLQATGGPIVVGAGGAITTGNAVTTAGGDFGISLTTSSGGITISNALTASGTGPIDISSAAGFTLADGIAITAVTGNVAIGTTGANALAVNGDVSTGGAGAIDLNGTGLVSMDASSLLRTANGAITVDSSGAMTLDIVESTGSAQISLSAAGGGNVTRAAATSRLGAAGSTSLLAITAGGGVGTAPAPINTNVGTLRAQAAAGGIFISEATDIALGDGTGGLSATGGAIAVVSLGGNIGTGNTIVTAGGAHAIELNAAGGTPTITLNYGLTTAGGTITFRDPVVLGADLAVSTGAGLGGNIDFQSSLRGTTATTEDLDLTAGTGSVNFTGIVGATALGNLRVISAGAGVTAQAALTALTVDFAGGAIDLNGTVSASGGFASSGTSFDNTGATITTTDTDIVVSHSGAVAIGAALSSGDGNVDIDSSGSTIGLGASITTTGGAVTVDSAGLTTIGAGGDIFTQTGSVTFGASRTGTALSAGDVTTAGGNIRYYNALELSGTLTLGTGAGGGNLTFSGALTRSGGAWDLNVTAGTGNVLFGQAVGTAPLPLGAIDIVSANDLEFAATVNAASLVQRANGGAGTRVTTLRGDVATTAPAGIHLGSVGALNSIVLDGLALNSGSALIRMNGPVALSGALVSATTTAGDISFLFTVQGAQNLTLAAGTGNVVLAGQVGTAGISLGTLTINSAANVAGNPGATADCGVIYASSLDVNGAGGTCRFGALNTNAAGGIDLIGSIFAFNGAIAATAGGGFSLANSGIATFAAAADATIAGAFSQTGAGDLRLLGDIGTSGAGGIGINALTLVDGPVTLSTVGGAPIAFGAASDLYLHATAGTISMNSGATAVSVPRDIHIFSPGATIALSSSLTARNVVLYAGTVNLVGAGITLRATEDMVLLGNATGPYSNDDAESGVAGLYAYDHTARTTSATLADPHVGLLGALAAAGQNYPILAANYAGAFTLGNLGGRTLRAGLNFYGNGVSLNPGAAWNLVLDSNTDNAGTAFAEMYRMAVANCSASSWVSASRNQGVTYGGANVNLDFGEATLLDGTDGTATAGTVTIYDNVIRVEIANDPISGDASLFENSQNEISAAVASIRFDTGAVAFTGSFRDPGCTQSTDGWGDRSYFYLQSAITDTWNTDADGNGSGNANSTDRSGNHQTAVANLQILKAAAGVFQTLRDSHKNRISHYAGAAIYAGVADACRPVLGRVYAGRASSSGANNPANEFDGHNYLQLRYSEPVDIGSAAGFTIAVPTARNVTAWDAFAAATPGGELSESGGQIYAGYLSFPGAVSKGSRDATAQVNALYRAQVGAEANTYGTLGLYISVGGRSNVAGSYRLWPGYFTNLTDPVGELPTVPYNDLIEDAHGCPLEPRFDTAAPAGYANGYAKTVNAIEGAGWDVEKPQIAHPTGIFEVVPQASGYLIDRVEFHTQDGTGAEDPIRDSSFSQVLTAFPTVRADAFTMADISTLLFQTTGSSFTTAVTSNYFGPINAVNDQYYAVTLTGPEQHLDWTTKVQFVFRYSSALGRITDLAGNLMDDYTGNANDCVENIAPRVRLSSAVVGGNRVYLQFTEPVNRAGPAELQPSDFSLPGTGLSVTGIEALSYGVGPTALRPPLEIMLTLSGPLSAEHVMNMRLYGSANVVDRFTNPMGAADGHRISDFGLGIIETQSAQDGVHTDVGEAVGPRSLGALRVFDGSGRLYDRNVTVTSRLEDSLPATLPVELYFDVAPAQDSLLAPQVTMADGSRVSLPVWQPGSNPNLFTRANGEARIASASGGQGPLRSFVIPSGDAEVVSGAEVEFLYRVSDLYCLRSLDPNDPRRMDLYRFDVQDISMQRGGVTILNNVIDPTRGERAAVQVDLTRSGYLTVQVFTLDGDVVRVLSRTPSAAGTFFYSWDGRNTAGRAVARGLYFIRVVGPGIDEIRKVIVVKPR